MYINIRLIASVISVYLMFLGILEIIPFFVAVIYEEVLTSWIVSIGITLASGGLLYLFSKTLKETANDLRYREGILIVTLIWLVSVFFYGLPLFISGVLPNMVDAYFEAMSGFTTTGATLINDLSKVPHSLLFLRSYTQWIGGMGIIVLAAAVFPFIGSSGMQQLFSAESSGITLTKIKPRIKETAIGLWIVYVSFTTAEIILLMLGGMNLFDAVIHSFSTLSTGGFSDYNNNVAHFNSSYIRIVMIIFMFLGGAQFTLHYIIIKNPKNIFRKHFLRGEASAYFQIMMAATIVVFIVNGKYFSSFSAAFHQLVASAFTVTSQMTSSGFTAYNYGNWPVFSQFIILIVMIIGGMAGSTGGGIKVIRLIVTFKAIKLELYRLIHPNIVKEVEVAGYKMTPAIVRNTTVFFSIYIVAMLLSTLLLSIFGVDIVTGLSASVACLSNAGPGLGNAAPPNTYSFFTTIPKIILTFDMLIGRLEFYTVLVMFSSIFWKK